jgi:PAS domain S-box-containing protein
MKSSFLRQHLAGLIGAAIVFVIGAAILVFPSLRPHKALVRASYDWSFDLPFFKAAPVEESEVVLVYLDEASHKSLGQPFNAPWDRRLHARLIQRLKSEGAKAVIFDIVFSDPGPNPAADAALAQSLRDAGNVILAADDSQSQHAAGLIAADSLTLPLPLFQRAAAGWGTAQLRPEDDFIVRQHYHGKPGEEPTSMTWAAARLAGLPVAKDATDRFHERWIRYYGGPQTLPNVSYSQAITPDGTRPNFFRDKIVVVGAKPITGFTGERRDEFRTSFAAWSDRFIFMPAVEVHATTMLNLVREDWLTRMSPAAELGTLAVAALVFGFGLSFFRPMPALAVGVAGIFTTMVVAAVKFNVDRVWFPWAIIAAVQIPAGFTWNVVSRSIEWYLQKRRMEAERRRADAKIHEQAALLDKAQDAIVAFDLAWHITYWNQGAARIYGWSTEKMLGVNPLETVFAKQATKLGETWRSALQLGEWKGELRQPTKEGKEIILESRWTLVRDDAGHALSMLVINTDITEKKTLEAQFLRTQRMESIGTLAGGIAHDLNNVLSPIMMGVELLQMRTQDPVSIKMLKTIDASARRGADMVKQVLSFARGHVGERVTLNVGHLVREMEKLVRETFPKNVTFKSSIATDLLPVSGDATQMHQILLNLCVNARDAMPSGGEITAKCENCLVTEADAARLTNIKPGNAILLQVTDTGTGMSPEIMARIFEPFFTTKEIGKGTGLGLSTVMSIVKSHGGALDLESTIGVGTTFKVYLPAAEKPAGPAQASISKDALRGKGETILLVDDEIAVRELTKAILTTHGYNVLTANDGAEAITLCSQNADKIKLVLMDMMMPVMDGATTMKKLNAKHPSLRFVAISGLMKADKFEEEVGLKDVSFLLKPFNAEKLLTTLHRVLSGQTGTIPSLKMAAEPKPAAEIPLRVQEPAPLGTRS